MRQKKHQEQRQRDIKEYDVFRYDKIFQLGETIVYILGVGC